MEELLKNGAALDVQNKSGSPTMHLATEHWHEMVVRLLEMGVDPNVQNKHGQKLLAWTVRNWHESVMQLLVEKEANSNAQYQTPLH